MIGRALYNVIGVFSLPWAALRLYARATVKQLQDYRASVGGKGGLAAGKKNRLGRMSPDRQE